MPPSGALKQLKWHMPHVLYITDKKFFNIHLLRLLKSHYVKPRTYMQLAVCNSPNQTWGKEGPLNRETPNRRSSGNTSKAYPLSTTSEHRGLLS